MQFRKRYADTPLGQVHYREAGSGPPLVLFHESPSSGVMYEPALPVLARRVRAIAVDTPGHGGSDPTPKPLPISGYAERFRQFFDTLGLDRVALVGEHTGAAMAIQLAMELPDRVKALIVVGCPLFSEEERASYLKDYLVQFPMSRDGEHLSWAWKRLQRYFYSEAPVEQLHNATVEFLRVGTKYDWAYRAAFGFEADKLLPKVGCPTLFLVTKGDGLWVKNEQAMALTPGSESRVMDLPYPHFATNNPEGYAEEVFGFLERANYLKT